MNIKFSDKRFMLTHHFKQWSYNTNNSSELPLKSITSKKQNKVSGFQLMNILLFITLLNACGNKQNKGITDSSNTNKQAESGQAGNPQPIDGSNSPRIVFFGNSLSAGYGLDDPENQSFPGIIREKLTDLALDYSVVNAGLSGETTAGGKNRIDWILKQSVDIFILELGGNDGLRGIDTKETKKNLQVIIDVVKNKYPDAKIILAGMEAPPNMGDVYTGDFRSIYPDLAEKNNIALIPFLLQNVGGETHLNQTDGIHPNVAGHKIVAENVWAILKDIVNQETNTT
ncbi:MAG: arylesterase [Bacteroidota bacterium]